MIIVLDHNIKHKDKQYILGFIKNHGLTAREIEGEQETILGVVGNVTLDSREVEILPGVSRVIPISSPYKLASREFKKEDTLVTVGPVKIGGRRIVVIAGPCAVESREQILETARLVKESGAVILRGGAYKPRSSPYAFQGLGEKGLKYLKEASLETGMPVITEVISAETLDLVKEYADILQVGARNMYNFDLLKRVGAAGKPVLLKRGLSATIQEFLMSAEYLMVHGAEQIILCERGIRTFETYTRNTLDLSAIPIVKKLSHLPIFVDPSHGTGIRNKVPPMALASIAAGAHGISVEVHPSPEKALSDGPQSLYPEQFEKLMRNIEALAPVLEKEIARLPKEEAGPLKVKGKRAPAIKGGRKIAFQGERGSFSEKAIRLYFEEDVELVACQEFRQVFNKVLEGSAHYGMIPIENSLSGSIHENYDLLLQFPDIRIVGEKKIRIVHNLIGLPDSTLETIRRVYSHPQGLAQCSRFLEQYPAWEKISFYDTAGSVAHIARQGTADNAAIASIEAAKINKLTVLKEGIETNPQNYTRFVIIAREENSRVDNPTKASLVFSTLDEPGALFQALKVLADRKLNMKKLESRPIPGKPWEYMFYIDVELPEEITLFTDVLERLKAYTENLRLLGMYRS
jgi:3-deoxy-7-phosphoheptulonate synthase